MQKEMHAMLVLGTGIAPESTVTRRVCFDACSDFDLFIYDPVGASHSSKHPTSNWRVWINGKLYV